MYTFTAPPKARSMLPTTDRSRSSVHAFAPGSGRRPRAAEPAPVSDYLSFRLGGAEYGVDLLQVHDIRAFQRPAMVADAPRGVVGTIAMPGAAVPVVDLRTQMAVPAPYDHDTAVIVLHLDQGAVGIVVDQVCDVVGFHPKQMQPAPRTERPHVVAIGAIGLRSLALIDIEGVLSDPALGLLAA